MTPDDLIRAVSGSQKADWRKVDEPYRGQPGRRPHYARAVWRGDADLTIEWGMEADDELHFDWVRFPDKRVRAFFFDVLWRGQLIFRERMLSVDGGRAVLPLPAPEFGPSEASEPGGFPVLLGEVATASQVARARLLDDFDHDHIRWEAGQSNFDRYWEWSGLLLEADGVGDDAVAG